MEALTAGLVAAIAAIFVLAGFVKGVTGMGLPTIAIGFMGIFMAPITAAAILVVPSLVTNVVQGFFGPNLRGLLARLGPFLGGIVAGTWAGYRLFGGADPRTGRAVLGTVLVFYGISSLLAFRPQVPRSLERWLGAPLGFLTGAIAGITGVFVFPAVPYLQGLGLDKDEIVQALGLSFTVGTIALGGVLFAAGAFTTTLGVASLIAVAPALAGLSAGQWLRSRISEVAFRRIFFGGMALLGAYLVARSL